LIPASGIKRRLGSFVGNDEMEAGFGGCKNTFPTKKLSISSQNNLVNAPGQMGLDLTDEGCRFLPVQNIALPEFAQEVLSGFIHKTQHRTVCFLPSMGGVVSHAAPLLIAINRFRSGIDTKMNPSIFQATQLPSPFPHNTAKRENRFSLINTETVHISPKSTGRRQTGELEKAANHRVQTDIDEMPQAIETDKEQHQNPDNHAIVTQPGFSTRFPVNIIENLFEPKQIQKLDQSQKTPKGAEPLPAGTVKRGSTDFSGTDGFRAKAFTGAILRDTLGSFLNHLGYLLFSGMCLCKPNNNRNPRWFSIFYSSFRARSRS
jgi:hypothetical protein